MRRLAKETHPFQQKERAIQTPKLISVFLYRSKGVIGGTDPPFWQQESPGVSRQNEICADPGSGTQAFRNPQLNPKPELYGSHRLTLLRKNSTRVWLASALKKKAPSFRSLQLGAYHAKSDWEYLSRSGESAFCVSVLGSAECTWSLL